MNDSMGIWPQRYQVWPTPTERLRAQARSNLRRFERKAAAEPEHRSAWLRLADLMRTALYTLSRAAREEVSK